MALSELAPPISISKAYSPGHVTGFFEPQLAVKNPGDDLRKGSKGVGFCIDSGITTTVRIFEGDYAAYDIALSDFPSGRQEVSKWIIRHFLKLIDEPLRISVTHNSKIPIGFGLGASGAGALSLSYALNDALKLNMTKESAAQIAHKAEIVCKTGLGTVMSEFVGGFDIRTASGAPGIGSVTKIPVANYMAVILCIAPISTKLILSSDENRQLMAKLGSTAMQSFIGNPTVDNFLRLSYDFSNSVQFLDNRCRLGMKRLRSAGFGCGVALFGKTIFTLVPSELAMEAKQCLKNLGGTLIECSINTAGAMVLKV
jgi:pantoate kinase